MINSDWVNSLFSTIDAKDSEKFVSFLTNDATFTFGNMPSVTGRINIYDTLVAFFGSIKEIKHHDIQFFDNEQYVIVRGNSTYLRHNGTSLTVGFCNVFEMEDNYIKDYRIYIDLSKLYSE